MIRDEDVLEKDGKEDLLRQDKRKNYRVVVTRDRV